MYINIWTLSNICLIIFIYKFHVEWNSSVDIYLAL